MLSVRDIMQADVVSVRADDNARALARLLVDSEISGAPVLDNNGRVVGVVSATDLVRLAADDTDFHLAASAARLAMDATPDPDEDEVEVDPYGFFLPEDSPFLGAQLLEQLPESSFDTVSVSEIMTPVTFAVQPDMPVPELCEFLVRGRIHRALVVEDDRLLGIVTSADVLRGVAEQRVAI